MTIPEIRSKITTMSDEIQIKNLLYCMGAINAGLKHKSYTTFTLGGRETLQSPSTEAKFISACHGVSLGRFWKYSNFRLSISLLILLRPPVARYWEAAIVWPRATCL